MNKKAYEYGFSDELKKIAGTAEPIKRTLKFISESPTTSGAITGALIGTIPSSVPLVVTPYSLSYGVNKYNVKKQNKTYLQNLPRRVAAGALTGAFLGKLVKNVAEEVHPKLKK